MKRYHKEIYFPRNSENLLREFCKKLNDSLERRFSNHLLDNMYDDLSGKSVYELLSNIWFSADEIFEFVLLDGEVDKACFRVSYSDEYDIIFSISKGGVFITYYYNKVDDLHTSLKREAYNTE